MLGYFCVFGIVMVCGCEFVDFDCEDVECVVVVNELVVCFYFGDEELIGKCINYDFGGFFGGELEWMIVVGVVVDVCVMGVDKFIEYMFYVLEG